MFKNHHIRDNLLFMAISFIAFNQIPTLARAQEYEYAPMDFVSSIGSARGSMSPLYEGGVYLSDEDTCHYLTVEMGWSEQDCPFIANFIASATPRVDTILINKPNTDGYIKFDDWDKDDRDDEIEIIWDNLVLSLEAQSEKLGTQIIAERWHVYPTLDKEKQVLYYATLIDWGGNPTININASVFDRSGYVQFQIVPNISDVSTEETKDIVEEVLSMYRVEEGQKYTQFISGDKVAVVGVVGVLATLVGVKYGKGAAVGLLAIALAFAKKAWFLLLLPFIYLKKLFNRKE